jgi:uracil permease
MNLVYGIKDKPKFVQLLIFAFQQVLAVLAATIAVPAIVGNGMSAAAALLGAGVGTLVYQLFTKFRSPVFLGSSFAFIGSMLAAFAGAASASAGFAGIILGAAFAGAVYVVIALVIKLAGVKWIEKLMPPVVIGPTVALIGLSLAGAAIKDVFSYGPQDANGSFIMTAPIWASLVCALVTLFVVVLVSTYGKKLIKLVPFIIGILAGYAVAAIFTVCGIPVIDFTLFENMQIVALPGFTFMEALKGVKEIDGAYIATIAVAYVPVAFVVFAEHIADHKNLSSIIGEDLLTEPGLHRTLLGDGVGSMVGAIFGGCPNTTYGESVGCVAITRNASVITVTVAALMCIVISFFGPFVAFLDSIPGCVMGGVCITLYGFIAVSGLKMIQKVDLNQHKNLFVVASILIPGIGGMALAIGPVTLTAIACALILGIITNLMLSRAKDE